MTNDPSEAIALHRWGVIAEAANGRLTPAERGLAVRAISSRTHAHHDGTERRYSRTTIDRWLRAWNAGGLAALRPQPRCDTGVVRAMPEIFEAAAALRLELPSRSSVQIASIIAERYGLAVSERTIRAQLARRGLSKQALAAQPKVFGRYEAGRPNERWITDALVDPWVPYPRVANSIRARLFVIVDDHSRLLVAGRFMERENTRAGQEVLRQAIIEWGAPRVLYCDNGSPFSNHQLSRTCAVLGIRLIHSKPYSPQGRGKQERLNRYIREAFLAEACHVGIANLDELNDRFSAWATRIANRRVHAETGETPEARWSAGGPPEAVDPAKIVDAFAWSTIRKVTKVATVSLEGNAYAVDPALVGRRVELRYDPVDLTEINVYLEGRPVGVAIPFVIGRHVAKAVPQAVRPAAEPTGVDYLGLVQAAHEEETVGPISFSQLPPFQSEEGVQ